MIADAGLAGKNTSTSSPTTTASAATAANRARFLRIVLTSDVGVGVNRFAAVRRDGVAVPDPDPAAEHAEELRHGDEEDDETAQDADELRRDARLDADREPAALEDA